MSSLRRADIIPDGDVGRTLTFPDSTRAAAADDRGGTGGGIDGGAGATYCCGGGGTGRCATDGAAGGGSSTGGDISLLPGKELTGSEKIKRHGEGNLSNTIFRFPKYTEVK